MTANIMNRVQDHYNESRKYFSSSNIVLCALQGSQNYCLDTEFSDVDTKLIVTPTLEDVCLGRAAISTTHVRENNEHIDFKDIRLYKNTFTKQNINFIEILFTPYKIVNPTYELLWQPMIDYREAIAHMNPYRAVKAMKGMAMEKYHAMEHPYPSKADILAIYAYDPKQLHHLVRMEDFITRYINGDSYSSCLIPTGNVKDFLMEIKNGKLNLTEARALANTTLARVEKIADDFCNKVENVADSFCKELLNETTCKIMRKSIEMEM